MDVTQAVLRRRSIRRFLDRPVDRHLLIDLLQKARATPSGGNLQPWEIVVMQGNALTDLKQEMAHNRVIDETVEHHSYPPNLQEPWRSRRWRNGEALYASLGISRDQREKRMDQLARNFQFFDAPVGLFFHMPKFMQPIQWTAFGMWMQTFMLLMVEAGLGSCAQGAWAQFPATVKRFADIPDDHVLLCGMAVGWPDEADEFNYFENARAPLEEMLRFID